LDSLGPSRKISASPHNGIAVSYLDPSKITFLALYEYQGAVTIPHYLSAASALDDALDFSGRCAAPRRLGDLGCESLRAADFKARSRNARPKEIQCIGAAFLGAQEEM
jgi:hypothetical protein